MTVPLIATNPSEADFIALWTTLKNALKVAAITGLSHDAVRSRASRLRRKGVPLPILRRGPLKPPATLQGEAAREARLQRGESQAQTAKRLGVSQSSVSRMEHGKIPLHPDWNGGPR